MKIKDFTLALRLLKMEAPVQLWEPRSWHRALSRQTREGIMQKRERKAHKDKRNIGATANQDLESQAGFLNCKCLKNRPAVHALLVFSN